MLMRCLFIILFTLLTACSKDADLSRNGEKPVVMKRTKLVAADTTAMPFQRVEDISRSL